MFRYSAAALLTTLGAGAPP